MRWIKLVLLFSVLSGCGDKKPTKPLPVTGSVLQKIQYPAYITHDEITVPIGDNQNITIPTTEHHPEKYQVTFTVLDEDEGEYIKRSVYVSKKRFDETKEGEFFSVKKGEVE